MRRDTYAQNVRQLRRIFNVRLQITPCASVASVYAVQIDINLPALQRALPDVNRYCSVPDHGSVGALRQCPEVGPQANRTEEKKIKTKSMVNTAKVLSRPQSILCQIFRYNKHLLVPGS